MQHARLNAIGTEIVKHDRDLLVKKFSRNWKNAMDAERILSRQGCNSGHGIGAKGARRLDISLNSRATAGI